MSFRKYGGVNYSQKHNNVSSKYNSIQNLAVTKYVGQPNSIMRVLSDIEGDIIIYGDLDICGNLIVKNDVDICGNIIIQDDLQVYGNTFLNGYLDVNGNCDISYNLSVNQNIVTYGYLDVALDVNVGQNLYLLGGDIYLQNKTTATIQETNTLGAITLATGTARTMSGIQSMLEIIIPPGTYTFNYLITLTSNIDSNTITSYESAISISSNTFPVSYGNVDNAGSSGDNIICSASYQKFNNTNNNFYAANNNIDIKIPNNGIVRNSSGVNTSFYVLAQIDATNYIGTCNQLVLCRIS